MTDTRRTTDRTNPRRAAKRRRWSTGVPARKEKKYISLAWYHKHIHTLYDGKAPLTILRGGLYPPASNNTPSEKVGMSYKCPWIRATNKMHRSMKWAKQPIARASQQWQQDWSRWARHGRPTLSPSSQWETNLHKTTPRKALLRHITHSESDSGWCPGMSSCWKGGLIS